MSEDVSKLLNEISKKLDTLIVLFKLSNRATIESYRKELAKDGVYAKILDITEEPVSYSVLSQQVAEALSVAEITVKKKIAELKEMKLLATKRQGREVFYENTGLLD